MPQLAVPPAGHEEPAPPHQVALSLPHHLDVVLVTHYLMHELNCDSWHVGGRSDHKMVVVLTEKGEARYAVNFDCSPPVEKAIYHGSRAWAMAITPLHGEDNLPERRVMEIEVALARLHA